MSAESKITEKVLLISYTKWDVIDLLPLLEKFQQNNSVVNVIGVDFDSWIELRKRNIQYRTPSFYFDKTRCSKIDFEALRLAKSWYKPVEDKITFNRINLGEMAEYNFFFLFMDTLRSIEIAKSLIENENPDKIWLPKNIPLRNPSSVRYEALVKAINAVAKLKGISVCYNTSDSSFGIGDKDSFLRKTASNALNELRKTSLKTKSLIYRNKITLIDVPTQISLSIKKHLKIDQSIIELSAPTLVSYGKVSDNNSFRSEELFKEFNSEFEENLIYHGVSLIEILRERFLQFFSYTLPMLINCVVGTEKFISNARPKLVVTMCDTPPIYRTITRVCKMNHIPSLIIQHGATAGDMNGFHVMPIEADKQAVWGFISKEWAVKRGKLPETQVITGNPRYDSIVTRKIREKKHLKVYDQLGLNRQKGIIVIATSWYAGISSFFVPEEVEDFISKTLEALKEFPEKQVVVKLHPGNYETYQEITQKISDELKMNVFVTKDFLWELLDICDLLITHASTVGLEAMLFNKPVITFYSKEISSLVTYDETVSVIKVNEAHELVSAIKNALYDKKIQMKLEKARRQFIYEYTYKQDGKASQRVAELIEDMIKRESVEIHPFKQESNNNKHGNKVLE